MYWHELANEILEMEDHEEIQEQLLDDVLKYGRGGGFLRARDRRYIYGERPDNDNADQQIRYRIRKRTKGAIEDFSHLFHYMHSPDDTQAGDIDSVFDPVTTVKGDEELGMETLRMYKSIKDIFKVLSLSLGGGLFKQFLEEAISEIAAEQLYDPESTPMFEAKINFEIDDKTMINPSTLEEQFDNGEILTPYELSLLSMHRTFSMIEDIE